MPAINESLVQLVLKEMLRYKPSLQQALATGGDEEYSDPRYTGQLVIKNFPSPIGVELRRLFSISLREPDNLRIEQMLFSVERCLQFVSFILISQLWNEKKLNKVIIPEEFSKEFGKRILSLDLENYIWIIRSIRVLFEDNSTTWFVPEIKENLDNSFFKRLDFHAPEITESGHYQIDVPRQDIENYCLQIEEKLTSLLQQISFLCNYKLASIQEIKVIKPKYQPPQYIHSLNLLSSHSSDPRSMELILERCAESHSVLLFKSQLTLNEYLNLTPFIVDTSSFLLDDRENIDVEKDMLLYHRSQGNHLIYKGSEVTEKCDLRSLKNYPLLSLQFRDMLETISGKGSPK